MSKSIVTFKITIDHDQNTVTATETSRKLPLCKSYQVTPDTVAAVYRDLAFYILESAHGVEHCKEFSPPLFTDQEARKTAETMLEEHRNIFEVVTA